LREKKSQNFFPQDIGMIVNDFLMENFSEIVDYNFTAEIEEQFDEIAGESSNGQECLKVSIILSIKQ
jgi:DNA topoisomerase I